MAKKWLVLGSAVGISSVVLVTSGFSAMAGTSGYDVYKSALKNTKTLKSVSVSADLLVQDNNTVLDKASGSAKANVDGKTGSGQFTVEANGKTQNVAFYQMADKSVFTDGSVYYVEQGKGDKFKNRKKENPDQAVPQEVENIVDSLVGNLKDSVTLNDKTGGAKSVSVDLSGSQIPAVMNAFGALAVKNAADHQDKGQGKGEAQNPLEGAIKPNLPKLTSEIKIEKVSVQADINASNYIEHQTADLTVSGKDANGAVHQVVLHVNANFSDFNNTTPDTVDLTGKNVQTIQHNQHGKDAQNGQDNGQDGEQNDD